jgi:transcriptional regulator with XRE-family HTH domain
MTPNLCRTARRKLGWSQRRLAAFAGVNVATISAFENGRTPLRNTLIAIQRVFELAGVDLTSFVAKPRLIRSGARTCDEARIPRTSARLFGEIVH